MIRRDLASYFENSGALDHGLVALYYGTAVVKYTTRSERDCSTYTAEHDEWREANNFNEGIYLPLVWTHTLISISGLKDTGFCLFNTGICGRQNGVHQGIHQGTPMCLP
jgi:hypothetical protein